MWTRPLQLGILNPLLLHIPPFSPPSFTQSLPLYLSSEPTELVACTKLTGDLIACGEEEEAGKFVWKMRNPEGGRVGAASAAAVSESDHKRAGAQVGVAEEDRNEDERLRMASTVPIEGMAVVELGCGTGLVR